MIHEEDGVFLSDEQIYCATFGSMVARQVMDHIATGRGAPGDDDMDRFVEEANTVGMMTLAAAERRRTEWP
jgi:hypothetical protein